MEKKEFMLTVTEIQLLMIWAFLPNEVNFQEELDALKKQIAEKLEKD